MPQRAPSRRAFLCGGTALALGACAPRGTFVQTALTGGGTRRVILATNRSGPDLGRGRSGTVRLSAIDVAMPPDRSPGTLPLGPEGISVRRTGPAGPLTEELAGATPPMIWVHGFNNTAAEAVYRLAQMGEDLDFDGALVAFAWPSAARGAGYLHDRDSVLHARDPAESFLHEAVAAAARPPILMAHSLGSLLVMEVLRQSALAGRALAPKLGGIVLLQPDIDPDVFFELAADAGPLPRRSVVIVVRDDPVLGLSARLSGRPERVGSLDDLERLRAAGFVAVDLTDVGDARTPHLAAVTSPEVLRLSRTLRDGAGDGAARRL